MNIGLKPKLASQPDCNTQCIHGRISFIPLHVECWTQAIHSQNSMPSHILIFQNTYFWLWIYLTYMYWVCTWVTLSRFFRKYTENEIKDKLILMQQIWKYIAFSQGTFSCKTSSMYDSMFQLHKTGMFKNELPLQHT